MNIPVFYPSVWTEYELLDSGDGRRLERFGKFKVIRPDPGVIWPIGREDLWNNIDAFYDEQTRQWSLCSDLPASWIVTFKNLKFKLRPTPFKHVGIFPEQAVNWEFISAKVKNSGQEVNVLNLFGYTGGATLAAAAAGAKVCHVDASKPALNWARENQQLSKIPEDRIRWILDDAGKFVAREIRRGNKYDGIVMDPPVFGHGPDGNAWEFNRDFPELLNDCVKLLSNQPLFLIVNAYAVSMSSLSIKNAVEAAIKGLNGHVEFGELCLKETSLGRTLSTGSLVRWSV